MKNFYSIFISSYVSHKHKKMEILDIIRQKLRQRHKQAQDRSKLFKKLMDNDRKCRTLRLQMARKNKKVVSRSEYDINEEKVKQMIYLSLQQLQIRTQLK